MFVNDSTGYLYNRSLLKSTNGGFDWQKTDSISTAGISNHFLLMRIRDGAAVVLAKL